MQQTLYYVDKNTTTTTNNDSNNDYYDTSNATRPSNNLFHVDNMHDVNNV